MNRFDYLRAATAPAAVHMIRSSTRGKFLGGGTNLVDLMRESLEQPTALVDVTGLASAIEATAEGGVRIGAAAKNTAVAAHPDVRTRYPMLSRAILAGASAQIRNMATVGGNLLQRTRCLYFYDPAARCNKRSPGAGCDALGGFNRMHAVLGTSPACIATHPSDMCVALAALDAVVHVEGPEGPRSMPLNDLHRLPGEHPELETDLRSDELILAIELPPPSSTLASTYRKVRDRASYAFALVSLAAGLDMGTDGRVRDVRLALGGVAPKPWRARTAEDHLRGRLLDAQSLQGAAEAELQAARGLRDNAFKIELARRLIVDTLTQLAGAPA